VLDEDLTGFGESDVAPDALQERGARLALEDRQLLGDRTGGVPDVPDSETCGMGPFACLLSAVAFGVMALFAKLAFGDGVGLDELLLVRFGLAGMLLLAVAQARGRFRGMSWTAVVAGLLMGGVGYAAQAGLYFAALTRVEPTETRSRPGPTQ
jgi:hypothetical protein